MRQYLKSLQQLSSTEERDCKRFVDRVLGPDGVFMLHIVSRAASDFLTLDVSAKLWHNFKNAKMSGADDTLTRFLTRVNVDANSVV